MARAKGPFQLLRLKMAGLVRVRRMGFARLSIARAENRSTAFNAGLALSWRSLWRPWLQVCDRRWQITSASGTGQVQRIGKVQPRGIPFERFRHYSVIFSLRGR